MNGQDWMDQNNNRADAVNKLIDYCMEHNLDYTYTAKLFKITLPDIEPLPTALEQKPQSKPRRSFDTSSWGPKTVHEDELPPADKPLEEGETPDAE